MHQLKMIAQRLAPLKTVGLAVIAAIALWLLYPARELTSGPQPADTVNIVFMGPGGPIAGSMADAVGEFEAASRAAHRRNPAHPVYKVLSGQDAARDQVADPTRFLVAVAGGAAPDVVWFDRFAVAEWAARGAFTPLDGFIAGDLAAHRPDTPTPDLFYAPCWEEAKYDAKVYGIPISVDDRALFYNKDLLKRAGLVDAHGQARPPRTWDELRDDARKLTERDEKGRLRTIGFAPNYGNTWLYMYGWMNDAHFMSPDGRTVELNQAPVARALSYMRDLYDDLGGYEAVSAVEASYQGGLLDPFIQGKVAMKIDGFWTLQTLASYGRDLNFGVAPPPRPARFADQPMSWCGGWALAIPRASRHPRAAWEFIRFLAGEHAQKMQMEEDRQVAESLGQVYIPLQSPQQRINEYAFRTYVEKNPRLSPKWREAVRQFNDLLPVSRYRPVTPVGQLLWNEQSSAMEAALYHRVSAQQALDNSTRVVQRALDRILYPVPGRPIRSWTFFFVGYGALLLAAGVLVYLWDTHVSFRRALARRLGLAGQSDGVIAGARGGFFRRQWFGGIACASPWLAGFIIFGAGPMLFALLISFCDYDILNLPRLTGLNNYHLIFSEDRLIPISLGNTLYMAIGVPLGMVVGLGIALLLNQKIRGMTVWRTFFYLPAIVPMVAASILWVWVLNPQGGFINLMLGMVGLDGPRWLQSATWSKPALILMGLWGAGAGMIIWLAGLKGIPQSLYEAAGVDGANAWQQFRHVTLPQLTPYIFFNLIMGLIGAFQIFGQAFIMTQGGPEDSTLFYVYHLFNQAFRYGRMGYAAAMAWVLFVIVLVLTAIQLKLARRWVHYGEEG